VREAGGFAQGLNGQDTDMWNGNIISGNDDIINALNEKLKHD
jgi:fructose-1,6-bisphosphatase/inositol monophosphatase family enzyme